MRHGVKPNFPVLFSVTVMVAIVVLPLTFAVGRPAVAHAASNQRVHIDCSQGIHACVDVYDSEAFFGEGNYVGHDEPSILFYSNQPGSGNRMRYSLTLPKDPAPTPLQNGKSFNFQLHITFWLGMAMCDTQSYPEQLSTCTPDSDSNIVDPAISPAHPGTAFAELQFYPPGGVPNPFIGGFSCTATQWCVALTIDSFSANPVTRQLNNPTCLSEAGLEPINFAFLTRDGTPQGPANPIDSTVETFTPNPAKDLFMNSGDRLAVTLHDSPHGLQTIVDDLTTGKSGFMTASAANTFGQVFFDPSGTTCQNIPYDFHPMYSTSSEKTRVPWTAHSFNVAFSDETGHFDYCTNVDTSTGTCVGNEGLPNDQEPADRDDRLCFPTSAFSLVKVQGCYGSNVGFDGVAYQHLWPDGNTTLHPTPVQFSSPLTGASYHLQYNRIAFETDLPAIEIATCNPFTGAGCTLIPQTDDGTPAVFYPFFSMQRRAGGCIWMEGDHIPGSSNDFGQNAEYGTLLGLTYTGRGGAPVTVYSDFRQILSRNPCGA